MSFDEFFKQAVEDTPLPFQRRFAEADSIPQLVRVPTGLGKTAMAVVGWLWRRFGAGDECRAATPRRLVYCLPMRVLVEQTAENARNWVSKLGTKGAFGGNGPATYVLMGGENEVEWDLYPEREAILVGTQDMLLSRALNRGYAASRARWPIQFGMLHTDCLWVFDEIQLMGAGLATTAQLEAFRRPLPHEASEPSRVGNACRSVWMSATMQHEWLKTVDFAPFIAGVPKLEFDFETEIGTPGLDEKARETLKSRWNAEKPLAERKAIGGDMKSLAGEVLQAHKPRTRTIIVVNTVRRAGELFEALKGANRADRKKGSKRKGTPSTVSDPAPSSAAKPILLHSRFRRDDRQRNLEEALAEPTGAGTIVVSTQVIEAGVDVSATTLFTELAPWASLVQRFGRCNRRGEANADARVFWIDLPKSEAEATKVAMPYELDDLKKSVVELQKLTDVGLKYLPQVDLPFEHTHVIRRKDLVDLFDTTPDLAGNDIDIDRFVRAIEDSDVRVFWRAWDRPKGTQPPPDDEPAPRRVELCSAPIGSDKSPGFRQFAKEHRGDIWRWSFLDKKWERADGKIVPGQVYLVHAEAGGYSSERGWDPDSRYRVEPINAKGDPSDAIDADRPSQSNVWQTIAQHVDEVCTTLEEVVTVLPLSDFEAQAMRQAARWHDRGKAHEVFQAALPAGVPASAKVWAKAKGAWKRYSRPHFRHELASSLAVLDPRNDLIPDEHRDLVAYLVAAHHGKVRLSIRSLPNERHPPPRPNGHGNDRRFARGVWDDDHLPATDLGGAVIAPDVILSLEPMELGLCAEPPFTNLPSWAERMLRLRDQLGPFRLAYLEAIVRAGDMRASRDAERREAKKEQGETAAATGVTSDIFYLRSTLDRDALVKFFIEEYEPTPIVAPWAGGSGFFEKDNKNGDSKNAVNALRASDSPRVRSYAGAIGKVQAIIEEENIREKPRDDDKARLIRRYRRELPDEVVAWMDAAMVLQEEKQNFAPLLGTGGNDGRLDFTQNFMQRVVSLDLHKIQPINDNSSRLIENALYTTQAILDSASIGQFAPGRAGGPNATQGMEGASIHNPWDFVLMIEGALFFAGAAMRRFGEAQASRAAFPFAVRAVAAGFDASAAKDAADSRGELWLPLWTRPTSMSELRQLFGEGRAEVSGRPTRDGTDFARAVAALGVDSGIAGFSRFGFLKRNGKAFLAAPLGRFEVIERSSADLLREADGWLDRFRPACSAKEAPPRFRSAIRRIDAAIFDFCKYDGVSLFQEILVALGAAERTLAGAERFRDKQKLRPLTALSSPWVVAADDRSKEFAIARALASVHDPETKIGPLRANLELVDWKQRCSKWAEKDRAVVWSAANLVANLSNVLQRRVMDGARAGCERLPVVSRVTAPLDTVAAFIAGEIDDERIEKLLWGLMLISDAGNRRLEARGANETPIPRAYALLKLLFLPRPLAIDRGADGRLFGRMLRNNESGGIAVGREPSIPQLLRAGRLGEACMIAMRRLRASGLDPMPTPIRGGRVRDADWLELNHFSHAGIDSLRLAAALLIPIGDDAVGRLVRLVISGASANDDQAEAAPGASFQ